ncbi:PAS and ANTAR domain-containing protein [Nocardia mexicana]|uniref:PAS domain-containing protein n=1 Tax=Nocardia mexicana TaxID=279262 RepID=A0A370HF46_9NOCA|nr:PAS and ANTAR domain-containing protein [Nocardia mexicana]RDI55867.1 PAS domain-containing protein [Nocardia mexicana]
MTHSGELSPDDARQIERVIGAGTPQSVGSFRFWFTDQRWEWSDEVAAMHGYEPGSVVPTTELLLEHKHPEDRELVATTLARAIDRAEPFCSRHRIIDTIGQTRHVIVVGDQLLENDAIVGTTGYYVDVTETLDEHRQETLSGALPELYEARAVIEQAKGALMLVYGISAEQAFRVLTWRSQETNVKLRALAQELTRQMVGLGGGPAEVRTRFDHLLLTVHQHFDL